MPKPLKHLGGFYLTLGYFTEHMHIYMANEFLPDPLETNRGWDFPDCRRENIRFRCSHSSL